ncbi:MAG: hypothetical protein L0338_35870 [Acidobacteria bacterium]|nr:hypothetical protein [Acidobacteriota bacterium]
MSKKSQDYEKELRNLMEALAESVVTTSDHEILAETQEEAGDPGAVAEHFRELLHAALKTELQKNLHVAQVQYQHRIEEMHQRPHRFSDSAQDRRQLLASVFAAKPDMRSGLLTAQHRDFESLTDADIESLLRQLDVLGVLSEVQKLTEEN